METAKITKQMIDFQKAAFNNSYSGITAFQDISENMIDGYLSQLPWVTEETKKPINDSLQMMKKARDDYKKMIDQGFERFEKMSETK